MNKVILMGRMTRDPELSQTPQGVSVARFSVAVNRRFAKDQTDFINCTAWRQQAEFICKYFKKGSMIALVGSIQTRSWDAPDGKKQFATDIVVDEVYFTGSKNEGSTSDMKQPFPDVTTDDDFEFADPPAGFFEAEDDGDLPF